MTPEYYPTKTKMQHYSSLRIMNYAVNGIGLGHLSRLIAINRHIRRYLGAANITGDIMFLTSSEADALCFHNGFPAFKIPSKTIINEASTLQKQSAITFSRQQYRRLAKQWVWNSVGLFAPNILIVDTFPNGSFHELGSIADFGMKKVFVSRAVKPEQAQKADFQAALKMYDRIIATYEPFAHHTSLPEEAQSRTMKVGTIMLREREECLTRTQARQYLGLPEDALCLYVSTGGGGDNDAEEIFSMIANLAILEPDVYFIFGAGALYRGREFYAHNIRWLQRFNIIECMQAFDGAISAGGYNTVYELLYSAIPTVFVAQYRLYDDQSMRIQALYEQNLCGMADSWTREALAQCLQQLKNIQWRTERRTALRNITLQNDARLAARYILETSLPEHILRQADNLLDSHLFFELIAENFAEQHILQAYSLLNMTERIEEQRRKASLLLGLEYNEPLASFHNETPIQTAYLLREARKQGRDVLPMLKSGQRLVQQSRSAEELIKHILNA